MSQFWFASLIWISLHRIIQWMTEPLVGNRIVYEMRASCSYSYKGGEGDPSYFYLFSWFCTIASAARRMLMVTNLGERTPSPLQMIVEWHVRIGSRNYFLLPCSLFGLEAKQCIYVGSIQIMISN